MADLRDEAVEAAAAAFSRGEFVVVVGDADRENEGDLIAAAQSITTQQMSFLVRHSSGVVCVAIDGRRADELRLQPMVPAPTNSQGTAFTTSVDLRSTSTTGISARERASTARALADPAVRAEDFDRPGHVLPLRAREGGVLTRPGHTEAGVDLARLAEVAPAAVLAGIVNDDGSMARPAELEVFAERHGLAMVTIADLVRYRRRHERLVRRLAQTRLPTRYGEFESMCFAGPDGIEHLVLVLGDVRDAEAVPVRVHSECLTGDVFGSARCDCGAQLDDALQRLAKRGVGVLVYLRDHEGHGSGLGRKLCAYALQDRGMDTVNANLALGVPVDARRYYVAAQILRDLGVRSVELMTANPAKIAELADYGVPVAARIALEVSPGPHNRDYLATTRGRLGHLLAEPTVAAAPARGRR